MRTIRARYRLWQIMLAIAVLAGLFAWFGVTGGLAILIVAGVTSLPVLLAGSGRRLRAAAMVSSLYPLLLPAFLYATWFTAWLVLGHRPRSSLDDPKSISPIVEVPYGCTFLCLMTVPVSPFVSIPLAIASIVRGVRQERMSIGRVAAWSLLPVVVWGSVLAILSWGLLGTGYVLEWYFD